MPAIDTTKVLVGSAILYTAPFGTAAVADTIAPGANWGSPWAYIGGTEEGVTQAFTPSPTDIYVDESAIPATTTFGNANFELRFSMSEDTLENLKLSYGSGGNLQTIAGGVGVAGKKRLNLASTLVKLAAGFEGVNAQGLPRRLYVPAVMSIGTVETAYRRAANNRAYPTVLRAVCDPSQIVIDDWTSLPS